MTPPTPSGPAMRRGVMRVLAGAAGLTRAGRPRRALLLPPAPDGSLGDQAMLDATVEVLGDAGWETAVVELSPDAPSTPLRRPATRIRPPAEGLARRAALKWAVARSSATLALGADVIDGVYSPWDSIYKLNLLADAHDAGAIARVLGCSFSPTPAPAVVARMRALPWLPILARDPVSQGRMAAALDRPVTLVADIAFLLRPEARAPAARALVDWCAARRAAGGFVLAVNASGHTLAKAPGDGVAAYAAALARWLAADPGRAAVLAPHDTRPPPTGDVEPLRSVLAALPADAAARVRLLEPPFDAWDAKAVAGACDAALTGRMHFAIAAFGGGAPALSLVYQGKFEGLMAHLGLDDLTLEPDVLGDPARLADALERLTARTPDLRARIAARLPAVRALSAANFAGITSPDSAPPVPG